VPVDLVSTEGRASEPIARRRGGFIIAHQRHRAWLIANDITTAADALALPGEIVCGHPDRHVVRASLATPFGPRMVFLKREHIVGWRVRLRNAIAGYGWVSRSEREAKCLLELERLGLPGPQWLAFGQDESGRAFLLVDELRNHVELRDLLTGPSLSHGRRSELAERIGRAVADLHDAGFETPDLSAKHVFVDPGSLRPTLIDWQSARRRVALPEGDRVSALATLTASLSERLAAPRDRLRVLWAYRRSVAPAVARPRFSHLARSVEASARTLARRSSVREQLTPGATATAQTLVWLTGTEAVCVRPELAADWPSPALGPPFYPPSDATTTRQEQFELRLPGEMEAVLIRVRSLSFPAVLERLSGRLWRSPAAKLARVFFHLERRGLAVLRLLAFGQCRVGRLRGDSFVLHAADRDGISLDKFLSAVQVLSDRRRALVAVGAVIRSLHDADCRLAQSADAAGVFQVVPHNGTAVIRINPAAGVRKVRRVSRLARTRELRTVIELLRPSASRTDRLRVLSSYFAGDPAARTEVRAAARRILGGRAAR
jgi:tRNA A-37 threonylcarbamoyl transferase component Bud32